MYIDRLKDGKLLREVGRMCKRQREINNITTGEIASYLGCTEQNIRMFEIGQNRNICILFAYLKLIKDKVSRKVFFETLICLLDHYED